MIVPALVMFSACVVQSVLKSYFKTQSQHKPPIALHAVELEVPSL